MKKITATIFLVLLHLITISQTINSYNNHIFTNRFRVINLFINIIYDVNPALNPCANDTVYWGNAYHEGINNEAIPTYLLHLMDTGYVASDTGLITRLYRESSYDSVWIVGDFIVVNVKESSVLAQNNANMFNKTSIVSAAIEIINNYGFSTIFGHNNLEEYIEFNDNQSIGPGGGVDTNTANRNFLYTQIIIRNITQQYGEVGIGSGISSNRLLPLVNKYISYNNYYINFNGKGTLQCVGGGDISQNPTGIVVHEISHSLFGHNNFHTSGGNHRGGTSSLMPFITLQNGYGLMGAANSALVCCNGYERWRMHWKHPDAVDYISAMDSTHQTSIISDIQKGDGNKTFLLRDFITYGDAVRIKLPYKDREDCSNQYIWLENHQVGSNGKLDFLQYANTHSCRPDSVAGIYAYYQIGRDVLSGDLKIVRYANERDNLKFIPAEGYFNYQKQDVDTYNLRCVSWDNHYYNFIRQDANPFNGYQDMETQFHPQDNDDTISIYNEYPMWRKVIDNQAIDSMPFIGDSRDMFAAHTKLRTSLKIDKNLTIKQ